MKTLVTGGYPRSEYLIGKIKEHEKGSLDAAGIEKVYDKATSEVIGEQRKAGIDLVTDGCLRWDDPVTFFAHGLGLELDGLERFFDNNFYYRKPLVKGKIEWKEPVLVPSYKKAGNVVPVCLGPYSLAKHSLNEYYKGIENCVIDFATAVNKELKALQKAGAKLIQLDEPSICFTDDLELVANSIEESVKGVSSKVILATYFGSVSKIFPALLDFPVDIIGIDFVSSDNKSVIKGNDFTKELAFGCMDARNTKLESVQSLRKEIDWALGIASEDKLYVKPNFGFDLLPHSPVLNKLKILAEAVKNE